MSEPAIEVDGLTKTFARSPPSTGSASPSHGVKSLDSSARMARANRPRSGCSAGSSSPPRGRPGGRVRRRPETDLLKQNIGYMSQRFSLYNDLTVEQNIRFFGGVYGLNEDRLRSRMEWVLAMAGLKGREDSLTRTLSGGWKQRLALGCAILHEPSIVFWTSDGRRRPDFPARLLGVINTLSEAGTTVLVTTHMMDEAEYCNDIILINQGRLIAGGSRQSSRPSISGRRSLR